MNGVIVVTVVALDTLMLVNAVIAAGAGQTCLLPFPPPSLAPSSSASSSPCVSVVVVIVVISVHVDAAAAAAADDVLTVVVVVVVAIVVGVSDAGAVCGLGGDVVVAIGSDMVGTRDVDASSVTMSQRVARMMFEVVGELYTG